MKKDKLFLALLTAAMATPATLSVTNSIIPVLAAEYESEDGILSISEAEKRGNAYYLPNVSYTGEVVTPNIGTVTWKAKGEETAKTLTSDDYTLTCFSYSVGPANADLTLKDSDIRVPLVFNITALSLDNAKVTLDKSDKIYQLEGEKVEPKVKSVIIGDVTVPASDYEVEITGNTKVGTGKVIVKPKTHNLEGQKEIEFTVQEPKPVSDDSSSNTTSSSTATSSSSSSSSSSSNSGSNGNGGSSTIISSRPKLVVNAGSIIEKTDGKLERRELKALENYIEAHNNPYIYEFTISSATVSTKDGKSTFTMSVTAKLDDESRVDLIIRNLKKRNRSEDAMIEEDEFVEFSEFEELEELEAASLDYEDVYDEDGDGKKVVIRGIVAKDAFRINDKLNGTSVRTILNDAGYKVSNLNFNSLAKKNNTFSIKNLDDPISIEVTKSTQTSTVSTPSKPVGGDGIIQLPSTPSQPATPMVVAKPVYRFYNTLTGEHFYTSSEAERNELLKDSRWNNEGQAWTAPESSEHIIYRVCNPNTGEHHFTMDKNEYDTLQTRGWRGEGIGFYSANPSDANIVHLYRLYNPKANDAGSHHYTASEAERDNLVKDGWNYEGVAWYGLK